MTLLLEVIGWWLLASVATAVVWWAFIRATKDRPRRLARSEPLVPRSLSATRDSRARLGPLLHRPKD